MSSDDSRESPAALRRELVAFRAGRRTVVLGTVGEDGSPLASYAPYIADDDGLYYVFVSGLSRHTRDLLAAGRASLMFIEDEAATRNPFARRRLTLDCEAALIPRDDPDRDILLDRFGAAFGGLVGTLRGLADFQLFRLSPGGGSYVRGFGQAFAVQGPELAIAGPIGPGPDRRP